MQNNRLKQIIIIAGFIILVLIVGFFGMLLYKKQSNPVSDGTTTTKNLFPFGRNEQKKPIIAEPTDETPTDGTVDETAVPAPEIISRATFRKITSFPVSGFGVSTIDSKTGLVTYSATSSGFIYNAIINPDIIEQKQVTNTTLPGVYETVFLKNPDRVVYRYGIGTTIQSFLATIPTSKKTAVTYCNEPFTRTLKRGDRGADVVSIQNLINEKLKKTLKTDGVMGLGTLSLTKQFQTTLAVPTTGIYDTATLNALTKLCADIKTSELQSITEPKPLSGKLLEKNSLALVPTISGNGYFSLVDLSTETGNANTAGIYTTTAKKTIFTSSMSEWLPQFTNSFITMTTKSSSVVGGYMYTLQPETRNFKRVLGPINGLTTNTSPDGKNVYYNESDNARIQTFLYRTDTGNTDPVLYDTLPEKCVWNNQSTKLYCMIPETIASGSYPDYWYQGLVQFSDTLYVIDSITGDATQIGVFPESIDGHKLQIDTTGHYLYVINRLDDALWVVTLNN